MVYFEYKVSIYDEDEQGETFCYGVTSAYSYPDAVQNILDYYGTKNVLSLRIEEWDCQGCLEMSKECLRQLREDEV